MGPDDELLEALQGAVDRDPDNGALRTHFAALLADRGHPAEALDQARRVLGARPADLDALDVARRAAAALGDTELSGQYDALLTGLGAGGAVGDRGAYDALVSTTETPDTADGLIARWGASEPLEEVEWAGFHGRGVRLADVGGMEEAKRRLELSFFAPLRNPEIGSAFGKSSRGGLLLWGPPGCGKTLLARAVAGELGASFYEVGLSSVLDMWIGSSERNLAAVFETARANRPCVLFFDEIDALGMTRTHLRSGGVAMRGVVNQLLAEMDGATTDNDGVFVMGATNQIWDVDAALMRPGRFDRRILVLPPDQPAREEVLRTHLRGKPVAGVRLDAIARMTEGYSGADLALVVDDATERAMAASLEAGATTPIRQGDLEAAVRDVKSSVGPWLDVARNYAIYDNDDGDYDELVAYLHGSRRTKAPRPERRWFR
jgi:AAA+ superfamily predicted ATPase